MCIIIWLAPLAGKMRRILCSDWISGFVPAKAKFFGVIFWPCKLVRSRWLDIGFVFFFAFSSTSTSSRSIKTQIKELGQYPAILTSRLVNNAYLSYLSVSTRAVIGQFSGSYFSVRPAKFKTLLLLSKTSCDDDFETYLNRTYNLKLN